MIRPDVFAPFPNLVAGFTTRAFTEAEPGSIGPARQRLADRFGFQAVASVGQVHGADVALVHEGGQVAAHDGLVTDETGLLLTVISADCALVLLADPESGVVGACHSGWRGTVANIVIRTVEKMEEVGAQAHRLHAYLSPCIGVEAFEVGEEVAEAFGSEAVVHRPHWERPHIDLKAAVATQLRESGVSEAQTEIDTACTATDRGRFYSYRAESGTAGRMVGFIGRKLIP